jgi:DNA mismatch repair protein MutL
MESRIKVLPEILINQIAAGEIVERPASILKELLENSLDSGADRIVIEIEDGGKSLIRINDNGCGMTKDEISMSLERHATSKLTKESDLMNISTLGFRGEAMPSIASVSKMSITSAVNDTDGGHKLLVQGGKIISIEPAPFNKGTQVEVRDLFFNVPARRKFLKSTQTEESHLVDTTERYALMRPDITLRLLCDGRELVYVDAKNEYNARLSKILGKNFIKDMRSINHSEKGISVKAYLSGPSLSLRTSSSLHIYVLDRPVRDKLLTKAIIEGYGRTLPPGRYPAGLVFVDLAPSLVDVNVHPAKTEVRFRNSYQVFSALVNSIKKTLGSLEDQLFVGGSSLEKDQLPTDSDLPEGDDSKPKSEKDSSIIKEIGDFVTRSGLYAKGQRPPEPIQRRGISPLVYEGDDNPPKERNGPNTLENKPSTSDNKAMHEGDTIVYREPEEGKREESRVEENKGEKAKGEEARGKEIPKDTTLIKEEGLFLTPLAQLGKTYILSQGEDGLVITDQHAAHERIIFDRLKKTLQKDGLPSKKLLFTETLELSHQEKIALDSLQKPLAKLGYQLEPFGENTWALKGVPALLTVADARDALHEILELAKDRLKKYDGASMETILKDISESWLHSIACRAAIKAGHSLDLVEMERLMKDILECDGGAFCPHGRPSSISISFKELEKKFGRT